MVFKEKVSEIKYPDRPEAALNWEAEALISNLTASNPWCHLGHVISPLSSWSTSFVKCGQPQHTAQGTAKRLG